MRLRLVHQLSLLMLCAVMLALLLMAAAIGWNVRTGFADYLEARDAERLDRFVAIAQKTLAVRGVRSIDARPEALRGLLDQLALDEGLPGVEPEIDPPEGASPQRVAVAPQTQPPPRPREELGQNRNQYRDQYPPRQPRHHEMNDGGRPPRPDRPPPDHPRDWPPHAPPPPPPPFEAPPPQTAAPAPPAERFTPPPRRPPPPETHRWGERLSIEDSEGRVLVGHSRRAEQPSLTRAILVDGQNIATARLYIAA